MLIVLVSFYLRLFQKGKKHQPAVVSLAIEIIKYIRDSKQKKESRANTLIFNNCTIVVNNKSELNLNMDDILNALKNE